MSSIDMYMENILDQYKHPRNFGILEHATHKHKENNPLCGDEIEVMLIIKNGKVEDVKFMGKGCAISMASASMLTQEIKGKSIEEVKKMTPDHILDMLGIPVGPVRLKCALLSLEVVHKCVYSV